MTNASRRMILSVLLWGMLAGFVGFVACLFIGDAYANNPESLDAWKSGLFYDYATFFGWVFIATIPLAIVTRFGIEIHND